MTWQPASGERDTETGYEPEPDPIDWHEVVDYLFVGAGNTALAAAIAAQAAGYEVLAADAKPPTGHDTLAVRLGLTDSVTVAYLNQLTEDAGPPATGAEPAVLDVFDPAAIAPQKHFFGSRLRDWAVKCLGSPYGLLCTTPTEPPATPLPVGHLDTTAALDLSSWLSQRAGDIGIDDLEGTLSSLVFLDGKVRGAVVDTASGECWVRAVGGVVIATGAGAALPQLPAGAHDAARLDLALASRAASRFIRLELVAADRD
ncbi:MAG: hypothetical protein HYZ38_12460 [Mycobacterium sp.]|nr:hypothetical protein [Mycobacterium sp.]